MAKVNRNEPKRSKGSESTYSLMEFSGDSAIYQQKAIVKMPLDKSMSYRTYRLEYDGIPTIIDNYTFTV